MRAAGSRPLLDCWVHRCLHADASWTLAGASCHCCRNCRLPAWRDSRPDVPGAWPGEGCGASWIGPPVGAESTQLAVRIGLSAANCRNVEANIVHIIFVCNF
ncbi:hypothetical protein RR42_m4021 [Cupriavidus basilensis]|uniref:Uncharacterized protein n=1 Tax=Cupriavidus basilensis TaxID=68895 RepID=A0A0C4YF35_9BURK|nr:hypothetical protein RR42_m4021 [Cupriavidus basilensis]